MASGGWRRIVAADVLVPTLVAFTFSVFCWRNILVHPLARSQSTGGEEGIYLWYLGHGPWSLLHAHNPFITNAINYPAGVNLLWNTSLLTPSLILAPITEIYGVVLTYNIALVLAVALSVLSAYAACRRFVSWWPAAMVGAAFVAVSPYLMSQSRGHLNLVLLPIPPLLLLIGDELLVRQRMRPVWLGLLLALLVVLQVGISTEILASSAAVALVGVVVLALLRRETVTRQRLSYIGKSLATTVAAGAVVLAIPAYYLFFGAQHLTGRTESSAGRFRADLLSPVLPTPVQIVSPATLVNTLGTAMGNQYENTAYLGVTLLALVVLTVMVLRRDTFVRWAGITALASLVLSFGTSLVVDGRTTGIPLPFNALARLPLLSSGTAIRYSYYTLLLCALVVAVAVDRAYTAYRVRPVRQFVPAVAVTVGVSLAMIPLLPADVPFRAADAGIPAWFTGRGVEAVPSGSVLLTFPYLNRFYSQPMSWQSLADFRYLQVGDYAITPDAKGEGVFDVETATAFVVTRLSIGKVLPLASSQVKAMVLEMRSWKVATVTVALGTPNADLALTFFTQLLHEQPVVSGGIAAFYDVHV